LKITDLTIKDIPRGDESADPYLQPGDVVLVVESDPIYVSGNVVNPRTVYFREPPSLLKAIAMAGGPVRTTSETKVVIYRAGDDNRYKEFLRIKYSDLKEHPERSPLLLRNDIIDVGPAGLLVPPSPPPRDSPPFDIRPFPQRHQVSAGMSTL
jgi:protein involved in polysaccharide export with SLBB domain